MVALRGVGDVSSETFASKGDGVASKGKGGVSSETFASKGARVETSKGVLGVPKETEMEFRNSISSSELDKVISSCPSLGGTPLSIMLNYPSEVS